MNTNTFSLGMIRVAALFLALSGFSDIASSLRNYLMGELNEHLEQMTKKSLREMKELEKILEQKKLESLQNKNPETATEQEQSVASETPEAATSSSSPRIIPRRIVVPNDSAPAQKPASSLRRGSGYYLNLVLSSGAFCMALIIFLFPKPVISLLARGLPASLNVMSSLRIIFRLWGGYAISSALWTFIAVIASSCFLKNVHLTEKLLIPLGVWVGFGLVLIFFEHPLSKLMLWKSHQTT
jgi:hypothetical protein